jgi:hypothetical protein
MKRTQDRTQRQRRSRLRVPKISAITRGLLAVACVVVGTGLFLAAHVLRADDGIKTITIARDGSTFEFTANPVQALHMSLPNGANVSVTHGAKNEYRLSGDATRGIAVFTSKDDRKSDVYAYEPERRQLKNTINYANGTGLESETYSYENVVLHKADDGEIEAYVLPSTDVSGDPKAKNVTPSMLDRAARTMRNQAIEDLFQRGSRYPSFTIPAPWVKDHDGKTLSTLTYEITGAEHNQLTIAFTAKAEQYPLTLDPTYLLAANADVIIDGTTDTLFAYSIATGDVNNDGKADLVVGAQVGGGTGRVYVFYNDGFIPVTSATADAVILGDQTSESDSQFGWAITIADMNNDGHTDLVVGANAMSVSGPGFEGRVYIFYGDSMSNFGTQSCASIVAGTAEFTNSSYRVLGTGTSWNNTMVGKVIKNDADGTWYRIASVLSPTELWTADGRTGATTTSDPYTIRGCMAKDANVIITGETLSAFGNTMVAGDFDNDGTTDLAISGPNAAPNSISRQGRVYLFYQNAIPWTSGSACTTNCSASNADVIITGEGGQGYFGDALAAGDLDGDGTTDLAVGADEMALGGNHGRVYLYYQNAVPWTNASACTTSCMAVNADSVLVSGRVQNHFGHALAIADLNNDGKDDIAVGAYGGGGVYLFYGDGTNDWGTAPCSTEYNTGTASFTIGSGSVYGTGTTWTNDMLHQYLLSAGSDVGYVVQAMFPPDILSIYPQYQGPTTTTTYSIGGCRAEDADANISGEIASDHFGYALATGDLNNDGKTDLMVGAPWYSSEFGRAYIFNNGSFPSSAGSANTIYTGAAFFDRLGWSFGINDLDGNGTIDLAIGANYVGVAAGAVYLYYATSSEASTTNVSLSRLKTNATADVTLTSTLTNTVSGPITVTFPSDFTNLTAPTGGSPCLSNFAVSGQVISATKNHCIGPITMTGSTVTNPPVQGLYNVAWVNDGSGINTFFIANEDQINVRAGVAPYLEMDIGTQTVTCDGGFSGHGGALNLGQLSTAAVASSDIASVPHICVHVSTNAEYGTVVTVKSANGGLKSTATADLIDSNGGTLSAGTQGYGICAGSGGADTGFENTLPAGVPFVRASPYNGACTSSANSIGAMQTTAQPILSLSGPSVNAYAKLFVKASASSTTPGHTDYHDTITILVTGTY